MAEAVHVHVELPDVAALGDAEVLAADDAAPINGSGFCVKAWVCGCGWVCALYALEDEALHEGLEPAALLVLRLQGRVLGVAERWQLHLHAWFRRVWV